MLQIDWSKTVRAIRLSSALLLTFFITWYCEVPEGIWALITCCVVLYEYTTFGGVLTKSLLRFIGTLLNALVGIVVLYLFANNPIMCFICLVLGIFINTYLFLDTAKTYTSVLGCVTLLIVFINYYDINTAILRTFNVLLGETICIITFYFVFPEYARDKVVNIQIHIMDSLVNILSNIKDSSSSSVEDVKTTYIAYEKIFLSLATEFSRAIGEAVIEVKNSPAVISEHQKVMLNLKHIYYLTSTFFYYRQAENPELKPLLIKGAEKIIVYLEVLKSQLQNPTLEKKVSDSIELSSHVDPKTFPVLYSLLKDFERELSALKASCEMISAIRFNHYKLVICPQ